MYDLAKGTVGSLISFCIIVMRPQNHRMVGVGRDLCGSSSPTPCRSRVTWLDPHPLLIYKPLNPSPERQILPPWVTLT